MISPRGSPSITLIEEILNLPLHLKLISIISILIILIILFLNSILILLFKKIDKLKLNNIIKRKLLLSELGINEDTVENGEELKKKKKRIIVGFFHPFCNAGGGGERVLWTAINCLQRTEPNLISLIYTGDLINSKGEPNLTKEEILLKVENRFGITLNPSTIKFISLKKRNLIQDTNYKRFTLLGQSIGSIILTWECLTKGLIPDIWIDTMGYAFTYPLIRIVAGIPIGSYTHYPTISTDMLKRVSNRQINHTNTSFVTKFWILTSFKMIYYLILIELYSKCLKQVNVLMVNSTWTQNHLNSLIGLKETTEIVHADDSIEFNEDAVVEGEGDGLRKRKSTTTSGGDKEEKKVEEPVEVEKEKKRKLKVKIVYPPCDTIALSTLPIEARERIIISLAQFRPEKDHSTQLKALKLLFDLVPTYKDGNELEEKIKLILVGSVRNGEDEERVKNLKELAKELDIENNIEFKINVPYIELCQLLGKASIGLHTMIDEHFGITVVEFMAAGLIPLVHASAGPLLDIVTPYQSLPTGYHATTPITFSNQLKTILESTQNDLEEMRIRGRQSASERFSVEVFERGWLEGWGELKVLMMEDESERE